MAEAVGIVAAAVQFASVGNTILSLILELRRFSDKAKRLQSQVNQLLALITAIQSRLPDDTSSTTSRQLESAILDCVTLGRRMVQLLEKFTASPDDSVPGRKWKAVLGVMKEKQFEDICDHLERYKSFLNLYISNRNSILLEKLTERFEKGAGSSDHVEQKVSQHVNLRDITLADMAVTGTSSNADMSISEGVIQTLPRSPETSLGREDLAAIAGVMDTVINSRFTEMQRKLQFHCITHPYAPKENGSNPPEERNATMDSQLALKSSVLDLGPAADKTGPPALRTSRTHVGTMRHRGGIFCTCQPRIRKVNWMFGLASFSLHIKLVVHHESCSAKAGYRLINLQSQAFNTVVCKVSMSLDANSGISICQSIAIRPMRDFRSSPAFRVLMDDFVAYVPDSFYSWKSIANETEYEAKVNRIQRRLSALTRKGKFSPLEVNQFGETLMSAALTFLERPAAAVCWQNPDIAKNLIRFIVSLGVPLDAQNRCKPSPLWRIASLERLFQHQKEGMNLTLECLDMGAEMNDYRDNLSRGPPAESLRSPSPSWYRESYQFFSGTSEGFKCNKILSAIISRSSSKLQRLLENELNVNERNTWGQTALHLSADWLEGLSILIRGGGDINCLDNKYRSPIYFAVGAQCLGAVELLLEKNCALMSNRQPNSVLWDIIDADDNILSRIISDFGRRLNRLRDFNAHHFSSEIFKVVSSQTFGPYSLAIFASLGSENAHFSASLKAEVPELHDAFDGHASLFYDGIEFLYPGSWSDTNFTKHCTENTSKYIEKRTLKIFDMIHSQGFTNLDGYNTEGYTLLLILCLQGKLNGVEWLLQKLQAPPKNIRNSGANAMHCIAEYLGGRSSEFRQRRVQIHQTIHQLRLKGVDPLVKCCSSCACLVDGNSPTATLTRMLCRQDINGVSRLERFKSLLRIWNKGIEDSGLTLEEIYRQMVLSETFTRLGLTHTCSKREYSGRAHPGQTCLNHFCWSECRNEEEMDDAIEIQDEEEGLIWQLDDWMSRYESERATFSGTVEQFFDIWWDRLPDHEPDFFPPPRNREHICWDVEIDSDED